VVVVVCVDVRDVVDVRVDMVVEERVVDVYVLVVSVLAVDGINVGDDVGAATGWPDGRAVGVWDGWVLGR